MTSHRFQVQSPKRVLKQAEEFRKTFNKTLPLPLNQNKSMYVEQIADYNLSDIQFSIERAKYQNTLFRKLEKLDQQKRKQISQSLLLKESKIQENKNKNLTKETKKHQSYNKHFKDVQQRYEEEEKKKFSNDKQQADKLRKDLKEFYKKQQQRHQQMNQKQQKVPTCYSNALDRMSKIQKDNEQFAKKAELQLQKSFSKISPPRKSLDFKMRSTSFDLRKSQNIFNTSRQIFMETQNKYIENYVKNQSTSLKAFMHKEQQNDKVKKRINEFFKKKTERWRQEKRRIDEQKAQVPQKCTQKIDKTNHATFRNTFSTFKDSFSNWRQTALLNRSHIKEKYQNDKDRIMNIHNDITLRNRSSKEVNEKMFSMKKRASKVAADFC